MNNPFHGNVIIFSQSRTDIYLQHEIREFQYMMKFKTAFKFDVVGMTPCRIIWSFLFHFFASLIPGLKENI